MNELIKLFLQFLPSSKYAILFLGAAIEGPGVTIASGFAASLGYLNFVVAYFIIVLADICVDCAYYAAGRFGRERFVEKWGSLIGINKDKIESFEKKLKGHVSKTLWLGKTTLVIGIAFLVTAGIIRYPFKKFFWINFTATIIKSFFLLLVGFYFGETFTLFKKDIRYLTVGITVLVAVLIAFYIFKNKLAKLITGNGGNNK